MDYEKSNFLFVAKKQKSIGNHGFGFIVKVIMSEKCVFFARKKH